MFLYMSLLKIADRLMCLNVWRATLKTIIKLLDESNVCADFFFFACLLVLWPLSYSPFPSDTSFPYITAIIFPHDS